MSNYYYLVAGLSDISFDDEKIGCSFNAFCSEIYPSLSIDDKTLIDLIRYRYDQCKLIHLLKEGVDNHDDKAIAVDSDNDPLNRGVFSNNELLEMISSVKKGDKVSSRIPSYMSQFVSEYLNGEVSVNALFPIDRLQSLFFDFAEKSKNKFVRDWFHFNRDLNNILAAFTARRHSISAAGYVIGIDEVAEALKNSGARDWGLSSSLDYFDEVLQIESESNLTIREKKIDMLKWRWMDENSFFNYFSIERLFTFLLKIEIVERWINLDKEKGQQLFRSLIDGLKEGVEIPSEFVNN